MSQNNLDTCSFLNILANTFNNVRDKYLIPSVRWFLLIRPPDARLEGGSFYKAFLLHQLLVPEHTAFH